MIDWYFQRAAVADHMLDALDIGINANIGLFAPRRKGKTAFLLRDLSARAADRGYLPVYVSMWQDTNRPHSALIAALEQAIDARKKRGALSSILAAKVKKAAIANELLGRMEIEFADDPKPVTSEELLRIDQLLTGLDVAAGKRKVPILLLDEIQHLATSPQFEPLAHALRTGLDKRQGRIKAIFTGSSRHFMAMLFNKSTSSMYNFVDSMRFPDLGDDFIVWLKNKLQREFMISVSADALAQVFDRFDRSPYWMLRTINRLITTDRDLQAAADAVHELLVEAEGLNETAAKLSNLDKIVFLAIADGKNPYGDDVLTAIEKSSYKPIKSNVQKAIGRLKSQHLVSQTGRGEYEAEKPGLAGFLMKDEAR